MPELNYTDPVNRDHPLGNKIARGHWWKILAETPRGLSVRDLCDKRSGTLTAGASWDYSRSPYNEGGSLRVAGASQEVLFGMIPTYDNCTQATMSAWLYISTAANKIGLGVRSGSASMFNMAWGGDGSIYFQCTNPGLGVSSSYPNCTLATGWHFVTAVYDGNLSGLARWSVWTDGTKRILTAGSAMPPSSLGTTAFQFGFGRYSATDWGTGNADDIMLLPFALTGTECQQLYHAMRQEYCPLLNWQSDEIWLSFLQETSGPVLTQILVSYICNVNSTEDKGVSSFAHLESLMRLEKNSTLTIEQLHGISVTSAEDLDPMLGFGKGNASHLESLGGIQKLFTNDIESNAYLGFIKGVNLESLYGIGKNNEMDVEVTSSYILLTKASLLDVETTYGVRAISACNAETLLSLAKLGASDLEGLSAKSKDGSVNVDILKAISGLSVTDLESLKNLAKLGPADLETINGISKTATADCETLKALAPARALNVEVSSFFSVINKTSVLDLNTLGTLSTAKSFDVELRKNVSKSSTLDLENRLSVTKVFITPINSLKGVLSNKILHFEVDGTDVVDTLGGIIEDTLIISRDKNVSVIISDRSVTIISIER